VKQEIQTEKDSKPIKSDVGFV